MQFRFEDLKVYQDALEVSSDIYSLTSHWPSMYKYNLADQFLRAALSIPLNIAEGSSRTKRDFQHFLSIARGSAYEYIPLIALAKKKSLISENEYKILYHKFHEISLMLSALRAKA